MTTQQRFKAKDLALIESEQELIFLYPVIDSQSGSLISNIDVLNKIVFILF